MNIHEGYVKYPCWHIKLGEKSYSWSEPFTVYTRTENSSVTTRMI